jgi:hypothetical protein
LSSQLYNLHEMKYFEIIKLSKAKTGSTLNCKNMVLNPIAEKNCLVIPSEIEDFICCFSAS